MIKTAPKKLLFVVANDGYFCSHRLPLARSAIKAGYAVSLACKVTDCQARIEAEGIEVHALSRMHRASMNPFKEVFALIELFKVYRLKRPDIIHHVALKPVVYGSLIAALAGIPRTVNALTGLGYLYTRDSGGAPSALKRLIQTVVRFGINQYLNLVLHFKSQILILQNPDDRQSLISGGCHNAVKAHIIRGSGVDIERFNASPLKPGPTRIACVSRMLWDKGLGELAEASRILKQQGLNFELSLYGGLDLENPAGIKAETLHAWQNEGLLIWHGPIQEVEQVYEACHIACLPSYREGLPLSLIEAASCGRAIVTTDVPGCREIVVPELNGLRVKVRDALSLSEGLGRLIQDRELTRQMGLGGRKLVEEHFASSIIIRQTLALYSSNIC